MSISRFFVSRKMQTLANELVGRLLQDAKTSGKKANKARLGVTPKDIENSLDKLYDEALILVSRQRMGVIRRASFAFAIQQALLDQGLPAQIATKVTSALVMKALVGKRPAVQPKA